MCIPLALRAQAAGPGSGPALAVGVERQLNAALKQAPEPEWTEALLKDMPLAPPYFLRIKRANKEGPQPPGPELPGLRRRSAQEVFERTTADRLRAASVSVTFPAFRSKRFVERASSRD